MTRCLWKNVKSSSSRNTVSDTSESEEKNSSDGWNGDIGVHQAKIAANTDNKKGQLMITTKTTLKMKRMNGNFATIGRQQKTELLTQVPPMF